VDVIQICASRNILSPRNRTEDEQSKQQGTSAFQCILQIFGLRNLEPSEGPMR